MKYDVIVIGAGLAGLTAGSLLAKSGLRVCVIDKNYSPGGSCGSFKRGDVVFDQGSSMLFGFGERGFNAHRFVFNCLEEPIDVIKHDLLYCVNFAGRRIRFWPDVDRFVEELATVFPSQRDRLERFYRDMMGMYQHVILDVPTYASADETNTRTAAKGMLRHPISYARFMRHLNRSAKTLLDKYFDDPEILNFFDKLTSTYCYTTLAESPAVLAAVMFIDNHVGGSYYPAGSTVFLPGKLEKAIEENGGEMMLEREVKRILFESGRPSGVELADGTQLEAANLIYSGTVGDLYGKVVEPRYLTQAAMNWAQSMVMTYPSVVLYARVDRAVIPADTAPIEMLVGNPEQIDEDEVTVYIHSIDDYTLCDPESHVVVAIGPSFLEWASPGSAEYLAQKQAETGRLIRVLAKRFPGFAEAVQYSELATPRTIERYTLKAGGSVAGPKQMMGQHMLRRQHTRTRWSTLYCCGEGTVMGTGTPAVTVSGISAANAILEKRGLPQYAYNRNRRDLVRVHKPPFTAQDLFAESAPELRDIRRKAFACEFCEEPSCSKDLDIRGLMRRVAVGNLVGARRVAEAITGDLPAADLDRVLAECEGKCVKTTRGAPPVEIRTVVDYLSQSRGER